MGIMAKVPRTGEVKTRLVPPLSLEQASRLSQCFIQDVGTAIAAAARERPEIHGLAVYAPAGAERGLLGLLPEGFGLLPQRGADLGERLRHATEDLLGAGFRSVCLVNSDSPTLPPALLVEAAAALEAPGDRVVLGPASDGGYYLIGLKHPHPRIFEGIAWSTPAVLGSTLERAREQSLEVHLLPEWYDVDDAESLQMLRRELFSSGRPESGAATRAILETLLAVADVLE
jgi:rSAM/selenodomain-associated transferase 1